MEKLSVSDGMELMQIMSHIERQRAAKDHVYMMLFSSENIAERAHYHGEMATRVLHMLGTHVADPENSVARCVREYVCASPPQLPDAVAKACTASFARIPRMRAEAIATVYHTACTLFLNAARGADPIKHRKAVQDAFLFLNLLWFPDYLEWLCSSDPVSNPDDVPVLDPDTLRNFVVADVSKAFNACIGAAKKFEDMVSELNANYILRVGAYNPDMHSLPSTDLPDFPDDYRM